MYYLYDLNLDTQQNGALRKMTICTLTGFRKRAIYNLNNPLPSSFSYAKQFACFLYYLEILGCHCVHSAQVKTEPHPTCKTSQTVLLLLLHDTRHISNSVLTLESQWESAQVMGLHSLDTAGKQTGNRQKPLQHLGTSFNRRI